jgi:acetoacetyl-CoA synthetase
LSYKRFSHAQLYESVLHASLALQALGVGPTDRVAFYGPNCAECLVLTLATTSLGAIWSSAATDFGAQGVLERFVQIEPKVLISVNAVRYNGKVHPHEPKLREVVRGLGPNTKVVIVPYLDEADSPKVEQDGWQDWEAFLDIGKKEAERTQRTEIEFYQAPFDHPLWILYSSGTTGKVHSFAFALARHPDYYAFSRKRSFTVPEGCCCKATRNIR